jgi:hypothetical protein
MLCAGALLFVTLHISPNNKNMVGEVGARFAQ